MSKECGSMTPGEQTSGVMPDRYVVMIAYRLEDDKGNMPFSKDTDTYKQGYISPAYFTEPRYSKYFRKYGIYEYVVFAKEGSIKDGLVEFRYDKILAKDRVY